MYQLLALTSFLSPGHLGWVLEDNSMSLNGLIAINILPIIAVNNNEESDDDDDGDDDGEGDGDGDDDDDDDDDGDSDDISIDDKGCFIY